ncbi:MAG: NTP transferase domain-containing protein, partial [Anaerolineae bacterium]|nr:NTP transferase domain-containing protein [Anaerolineae bacterium]
MAFEYFSNPQEREPVKAILLAAGPATLPGDDVPLILKPLSGKAIVDYVVENMLQFAACEDIYVVVGYEADQVRRHLDQVFGLGLNYVHQQESRGTAHAVLQTKPQLGSFEGDILILYADTPLFRASSIRGLLNRHRLTNAAVTLLT